MNKEELLFNDIYNRTQDFGRTQFVREIMRLQRENKELQAKVNQLETNRDEAYKLLDSIDEYMLVEQHLKLVEAKKLLERGKE